MDTMISASHYKDLPSLTIESGQLRAAFLPAPGAKLASLVYKPLNYELLVQRPGPAYLQQPFDGDYVSGECSGLDDMFPTIDLCHYDRFPWESVKMADHGEVWSLPWDYRVDGQKITFTVHGVRFPYLLEKSVSFASPGTLRLDYRLTNLSEFDFECLWAGHTMINLEENVELVLPEGVHLVNQVFSMGVEMGAYARAYPWPTATLPDGREIDFRIMRPKATAEAYKYYVDGKMPAGWCALRFHRSRFSLMLSFPTDQVPYLGVLPNEGGWQDLYNIFLEPCTATFDRPDLARYRKENSILPARSTRSWYLNLTVIEGVDLPSQ